MRKFLFLFLFVGIVFAPYQQAKSESGVKKTTSSKKTKEAPTKIKSDIMDIKRKSQIIDFLGNVVVEKEDSSMLADKMTVLYEESSKKTKNLDNAKKEEKSLAKKDTSLIEKQSSSIKRINAKENVKIFSEEFIASGDTGYYDPSANIFVLEKNVMVNNGISIASGNKFIYNITTKKGSFVGYKNEAAINKTEIEGYEKDKRVVVVIGNDVKDQKKSEKSKEQN